MRKKKYFKRALLVLIIFVLLFFHFVAPRLITEIKNPLTRSIKGIRYVPDFHSKNFKRKEINFISFDSIHLVGFLTYSKLDLVKGTLILLHGVRSNKESFLNISRELSQLGYNSIALDLRAHGSSGGKHCTYGVKEKKDISKLIDFLEKEEHITKNIGIWGRSLGGAIALQSLGNDKRIKYGIVESAFSDFRITTHDYFRHYLGFDIEFLTDYLVDRAGVIAGFEPKDAKPLAYCENINQPILFIHGKKDKRVDIKYARANFARIPNKDKVFIELENANHVNVRQEGGKKLSNSIKEFINKNTK